jgi:hypothetical protein
VVLLADENKQFIKKDVCYEDSDHHALDPKYPYPRMYPRQGE